MMMRIVASTLTLTCAGCVVAPTPLTQNCRQVSEPITVGGKSQTGYGVVCQRADGSWALIAPLTATPQPVPTIRGPSYLWPNPGTVIRGPITRGITAPRSRSE